ncbi:MAG TPA: SDR family NAD(P)-dependent oxidoreductase [Myxococcaceae bacterium]
MVLDGQVAIVTGGSRGIGRAISLELAAAGAAVVVNYRAAEDAAAAAVAAITGTQRRAVAVQADVTKEADVKRLVSSTLSTFGRLDILVCNAGITKDKLVAAMSLQDWESVIETNLRGPFLCVREVVPTMMSARSGSIILMSSIAADRGGRGHANYSAAKGGINAMVRALAVELAPKKIRVNGVAPGVIVTDMTERIREFAEEEILRQVPLKRYGRAEEVARAVRFLASDDASYVTGEVLHVTGGLGV